jgi:hypothetical protein
MFKKYHFGTVVHQIYHNNLDTHHIVVAYRCIFFDHDTEIASRNHIPLQKKSIK